MKECNFFYLLPFSFYYKLAKEKSILEYYCFFFLIKMCLTDLKFTE